MSDSDSSCGTGILACVSHSRRSAGPAAGMPVPQPTLLNPQKRVAIAEASLRRFLATLATEAGRGLEFSVLLATDSVIRRYNRDYRGKDAPTDVLAFPSGEPGHAGDLLVSAETARRQARALGHSVEQEIQILIIHGLLHLLGHDHHGRAERERMVRAERRWRRRFALPMGLIDRADVI
jgi:probable rRNA maturation factor